MNTFFKSIFCLAATILLAFTAQARTYHYAYAVGEHGTVAISESATTVPLDSAYGSSDYKKLTGGPNTRKWGAKAEEGYDFVGWSESENGEIVSTDNPYTVTVERNKTLRLYAHFAPSTRYVNFTAHAVGNGGTVAVNTSNTTPTSSAFGASANLARSGKPESDGKLYTYVFARPAEGDVFTGWSTTENGSIVETANPVNYGTTVTASNTSEATAQVDQLYAHFAKGVARVVSNGQVYASILDAYNAAAATDEIQLLQNLSLNYNTALSIGKNLTLSPDPGHAYTITRGATGCAISVPGGKTLTLANIVVEGAGLNGTSAMILVQDGGTFTLADGATIQNCRNVFSNGGAINAASGATVNLTGGTITGCAAAQGGAVYLASTSPTTETNVYKYFKFVAKKTYGNQPMQLSELKLFDSKGNRINGDGYTAVTKNADPSTLAERQCVYITPPSNPNAAPWNQNEGPEKLFDGNTDTKLGGDCNLTDANDASKWLSIAFRLPDSAPDAASYMITTANDSNNNRNPTDWTLYGSADGANWTELDSRHVETPTSYYFVDYATTPWPISGSSTTTTGSDAAATLNVSGNPTVAANTALDGTTLANVQPTKADQIHLAGAFGGSVGVNWPTTDDVEGAQFGAVTSGDSAEGIFYDGDATTYVPEIDGGTLVWAVASTEPVCRIGDVTYTSIRAALRAAQPGETIVLLKDLEQKTNLAINKNVTIDGDGHSITRTDENGGLTIGAAVTLKNLTLDGANVPASGPLVSVTSAGSLALPNAVYVTKGANGGISALGPVTVAGSTTIANNAGGNLSLASAKLFSISGPLTGKIGIAYPTSVTEGAQFGTVGAYTVAGSDVRNLACDNDSTFRATARDGVLKWTKENAHYPDGGKSFQDLVDETAGDAITIIEIGTSVGDGSDIVIPAGRDVTIDLKGATLTMDVIANGKVTIIDSSVDKTGKLVGELVEGEGGDLTIEAGTFTQRPEDAWLAENCIVVDNVDGTYTVVEAVETSAIAGVTLDTRRGVRVVENPYEDVLPLTYASSNWVFQASTNQNLKSLVTMANAQPFVDGDFANAQWHDGMTNNVALPGDGSYDYPSGNANIVETAARQTLYDGSGEGEFVWQDWRAGLVQAVIANEAGVIRAWYKFPDQNQNIVPVLPGDPTKVQNPDYENPDDMNTPGNADYPGYSVTNDVTHPWNAVLDPINPFTPDPNDPSRTITNYVAQTSNVGDPANTEIDLLIRVVGPGTLTWNDLIVDGSEQQDSVMMVSVDGGEPITVHTGGMSAWDLQKVVYGGDVDTVHTVRIIFKGNSSGDTANQAAGYVDNIQWQSAELVTYEQVKAGESLPFTFANLGTEPTAETSGETHLYKNGAETYEVLPTISTVDDNGKQLTSQTTSSVKDTDTGTEDYWYAVSDPGADNVANNVVAQTAPTLSANESTTLHISGIDGPAKFNWDMKIDESGSPSTPARLDVVVTKTYTDPASGETTVTVTTNTYTAAEIATWTEGYKSLGGEIGCVYDVDFIFTNNSDGTAVGSIDNLGWSRPDVNVAPILHDGDNQPPTGSAYGADDKKRPDPTSDQNVNKPTDPYYAGYTLGNDSRNLWEVVPDPKSGDQASDPGKTGDTVAQTPDSLGSGETTKLTVTVEGDGEFRWKSFIDDGTGTSDKPATFIVVVDGVTNQVYSGESAWTDHVVHVKDVEGADNGTHIVEIIYVQEAGANPDATGFVDNFSFEKAATNDQLQTKVLTNAPAEAPIGEDRSNAVATNDAQDGWMPNYDENGEMTGVRSPDGTEGVTDGTELTSTFKLHVVGSGEVKIERIIVPEESAAFDPDNGTLTIKVDDKIYKIPPQQDGDVSYSVVTNNGVVTISNLVIQLAGDSDTPHDVAFIYHREANDPSGNTAAVVEHITWKSYCEDDAGGTSWLQGKELLIIDHDPCMKGWCYLAFRPDLKVEEELTNWVTRSANNGKIMVKYGQTRAALEACEPVVAELSTKPEHAIKPVKVWVRVKLADIQAATGTTVGELIEPVGYWRIYIAPTTAAETMARRMADTASLQEAEPAEETGAESANVFGVLKIESATTNTMIAVPWTWYSATEAKAEDIPVKKLVKTTNLTEGDMLYCWSSAEGRYASWRLEDGEWMSMSTVMVDALGNSTMTQADDDDSEDDSYEFSTRVPRGSGIWITRQNPVDSTGKAIPFWIYGQSVTTEPTTEILAPTGTQKVVSTMLGNPFAKEVRINDLVFEGTIASNDRIWVPDGTTTPKYLIYNEGQGWCYTQQKVVNRRRTVVYDYDVTVPAGKAFWYDRRGSTPLTIKWTRTEE